MKRADLTRVLRGVLGPDEPDIGCDECFDEIDRYVELEIAGENVGAIMPGLCAHLIGCPACREEYESLRALVTGE